MDQTITSLLLSQIKFTKNSFRCLTIMVILILLYLSIEIIYQVTKYQPYNRKLTAVLLQAPSRMEFRQMYHVFSLIRMIFTFQKIKKSASRNHLATFVSVICPATPKSASFTSPFVVSSTLAAFMSLKQWFFDDISFSRTIFIGTFSVDL